MYILSKAGVRRFKPVAEDRYGTTYGLGNVADLSLSSPDGEHIEVSILIYNEEDDLLSMPLGYLVPGQEIAELFTAIGIDEPISTLLFHAENATSATVTLSDEGDPVVLLHSPEGTESIHTSIEVP